MVLNNDLDFQKKLHKFENNSRMVDTRNEITKSVLYFENKSNVFKEFYYKNIVSFLVLFLFAINKKRSKIL